MIPLSICDTSSGQHKKRQLVIGLVEMGPRVELLGPELKTTRDTLVGKASLVNLLL